MIESFSRDIQEQPDALHRVLDAYAGSQRKVITEVAQLLQSDPCPPVLLGMGASCFLCVSAAYSFAACGRLVLAPEAGEWLHYLAKAGSAGPMMLVSCSGESAEIVRLARESPADRATIAVVNDTQSSLARGAEHLLPMHAGMIRSSATKGITNPLAILQLMAHEMNGTFDRHVQTLRHTADAMAAGVAGSRGDEIRDFLGRPGYVDMVGRGPAHGIALCGGLLLREMIPVRGCWMAAGTFRHGPLLDVDETHSLICFAAGATAGLGHRLAADAAGRGGRVVLVSDRRCAPIKGNVLELVVPCSCEESFAFMALQLVEQYIAATIERDGTPYHLLVTTTE